jgi:hypothetical protein
LFTGAGSVVGSTQDPGAQLLLISVEIYVKPIGFGGFVVYQGEANQSGSMVFGAPWPVDKLAGFGKVCALIWHEKTINRTNKVAVLKAILSMIPMNEFLKRNFFSI